MGFSETKQDTMILEIRTGNTIGMTQQFLVKDGRKVVAKISSTAQGRACLNTEDRFQISMNGCAFYRATGREAAEFVRASVEQKRQAFGSTESVSIRGLEVFGI